jgi:hypothetical protein
MLSTNGREPIFGIYLAVKGKCFGKSVLQAAVFWISFKTISIYTMGAIGLVSVLIRPCKAGFPTSITTAMGIFRLQGAVREEAAVRLNQAPV